MPPASSASCADAVRQLLLAPCSALGIVGDAQQFDYVEVFLDLEHAAPSAAERRLFDASQQLLEDAERTLCDLATYGEGGAAIVRSALRQPEDVNVQMEALNSLSALCHRTRFYYSLCARIEQLVPELLWELVAGPLAPVDQLAARQAIVRQWSRLLQFALTFDALKSNTPALQNDFSFYKRLLGRPPPGVDVSADELETAGIVSLWLAEHQPQLGALAAATRRFVAAHPALPRENTTDTLLTIMHVCRYMASADECAIRLDVSARLRALRVLVASLILFDHVHEKGAFAKTSAVPVKAVVELIRSQWVTDSGQSESLLNALRYSTKHLLDPDTPKPTRALLLGANN